jgi:hypothetical protein
MPPTPEDLAKAGTEAAHQTALFCWAALPDQRSKFPELEMMFHIPNGGSRNKIEAGHLKAEGVKPGVPDIFLPIPRGTYHGFWIEMKVKKNQQSDEQKIWEHNLAAKGYAIAVARSWIEARDFLIYYLELGK